MSMQHSILTSFSYIVWLVFSPSLWQHYIQRIDGQLSPDFALINLNPTQKKLTTIKKLLWLGHGLWAIWSSLFIALFVAFFGKSFETLLLVVCYTFILSLTIGLLSSLFISVAFGLVASSLGTIVISLPIALMDNVVFSMAENIAFIVMFNVPDFTIPLQSSSMTLVSVLSGIFIASYASSIMHTITVTAYAHPFYRQIGSIVTGVIVSSIVIFFATNLLSSLARHAVSLVSGDLFGFVYDSLISSVFGVALALIYFLYHGQWRNALILGIISSLLLSFLTYIANIVQNYPPFNFFFSGIHLGLENALMYVIIFSLPYVLAKKIATPWAGLIAGIFGSSGIYVAFAIVMHQDNIMIIVGMILVAIMLGLSATWWLSLILYPITAVWNLLLYRADERRVNKKRSLLRFHSAFWDERQKLPLFGLENYLVMVIERYPQEGKLSLNILTGTSQQWAVQEAQIELDAKQLEQCGTINTISQVHRQIIANELGSSASTVLRTLTRISRDVSAALNQESRYNQRLALDTLEERLDNLLRELMRSSEFYAKRFHPIAAKWRQILADYSRELSETVESQQEINNPYIIGIPLTEHQEIFVGRSDVSAYLEQLLLDRRCPPLLLYGQRRTGKTSLLNNLGRLLPSTIVPLFVDLQGPTSLAKNYAGFLYNMGRAMSASAKRHRQLKIPALDRTKLNLDPFTTFDEWLDDIEDLLEEEQTVLLSLDEFSTLEHIFNKGYLDENLVLGMFRHIIQHRPRFKLLLSGSHTLDEFERWASYLINVRTVHLSYLQAEEALQLIERPVKAFELHYTYDASQRVMTLTRCHPALIQLICAEIVTLKNKHHITERRLATVEDVNAAIQGALQNGRFFFADIMKNQITEQGVAILRFIALQGEQVTVEESLLQQKFPDFDNTVPTLLQRELLEKLGERYRFQIELVRQWFLI